MSNTYYVFSEMPVLYYMQHIPPSISPSIAAKYSFTYSINLCITGESPFFLRKQQKNSEDQQSKLLPIL